EKSCGENRKYWDECRASVDGLEAAKHAEQSPGVKYRTQNDPAQNAEAGVQAVKRHAKDESPLLTLHSEVSENGKDAGDEYGHYQRSYRATAATMGADSVSELGNA